MLWLILPLARLLMATWRRRRIHPERFDGPAASSGQLASLWHGRMFPGWGLHLHRGLSVLSSTSDDGRMMASVLQRTGFDTIWGSSNKQPTRALKAIIDRSRQRGAPPACVVLTPDGPRGPRYHVSDSLAFLASRTGLPVVPCGLSARPALALRTWDRLTIPWPFARVVAYYGEPIHVPAKASAEDLAAYTTTIRSALLQADAEADRALGIAPDALEALPAGPPSAS